MHCEDFIYIKNSKNRGKIIYEKNEKKNQLLTSIVSKLNEKLTITKSDLIATERKSTENLEAYNLVMKAYQYINNPIYH